MKKSKVLFLISAISLLLFIILLINVTTNSRIVELDSTINSVIPSIQINSLVNISKIIEIIFDTKVLLIISLLLALIIWFRDSKKNALFLVLPMLIGTAAIYLSKILIHRLRPLNSLIRDSGFSFPSGHSTIAVIFFGILAYLTISKLKSTKTKILTALTTAIIILIIGFSRIYINVHWSSDVLAGFCLGLAILTSGIFLKQILDKY